MEKNIRDQIIEGLRDDDCGKPIAGGRTHT